MKTHASILVKGIKQRFYSGNTVYLSNGTEFEIEFFNKSSKTVCPSITVNGEGFKRSPVIYNGQKYVLKDFITIPRKLLFQTYMVDALDNEVQEAIKDNGIIRIKYYYEKEIKKHFPPKSLYSEYEADLPFGYRPRRESVHFQPKSSKNAEDSVHFMPSNNNDYSREKPEFETGKIMKGSSSDIKYNSVKIDLDYSSSETQEIKILPLSKKPKTINCNRCDVVSNSEANYCSNCGISFMEEITEDGSDCNFPF